MQLTLFPCFQVFQLQIIAMRVRQPQQWSHLLIWYVVRLQSMYNSKHHLYTCSMQDWRQKLEEMDASITAKDMELAKRTEELSSSQKEKEVLTHKMAEIREEIESGQRRIKTLLQEKDALERDLKLREAEIEILRLKNLGIATTKEQEIAHYQKQLESIRQELEAERKNISPLQEELQRKRVEVAEIREEIESGQRRIKTLLQEKDALERDLKVREAEIEVLRLKNLGIATAKEQEIAHYQKQLESIRQELEAERKNVSPLQEELQRKRVEVAEIREEIESGQRRIKTLLREKDALERDLKLREAEIEVLRLKNLGIATAKEQEIAHYQKQLESIRQELKTERKNISPLQEELQRKRVEVAEKMKDIQYLTEARDKANCELEREREKAEQKSKELAAAAISHAAHAMQFQVCWRL